MPIGVFDSGLGGLTVLRALRARLPEQGFVYFGDQAHAPYGVKGPEEIYRLTCMGVERLFARGCDLVILACNTASAVALRRMQEEWVPPDRRVLGVFVPVIEVLAEREWADARAPQAVAVKRVAQFATRATVESGAFARELAFRACDVRVEARACDGLVDAIEGGDRAEAARLVGLHVAALLKEMPDPQVAVLGCTHYPLVEAEFRKALPDGTRMLSQPEIVAESLADYLRRRPAFADSSGAMVMLTSGDPLHVAAQAASFGGEFARFEAV